MGLAVIAVAAAFSWVFFRNAWLGDDDFITFRSVEQLFAGHGPRWNPHERVQAFTHPLWFLLLAAGRIFCRDVFWTSLGLAYLCTMAALAAAWRILDGDVGRWVAAVGFLVSSKAFVDYCATGLENALSFLLLAVFVDVYLGLARDRGPTGSREERASANRSPAQREGSTGPPELRREGSGRPPEVRREGSGRPPEELEGRGPDRPSQERAVRGPYRPLLALTAVASLVALCRHDLLLICAPPLAAALWRRRQAGGRLRGIAAAVALGSLPLAAWTAFSLSYYGFPFPNTAYAKLATGIPESELWRQGLHYLSNAARWDSLTPAVCLAGIVVPPLLRPRWAPVACGLAAYSLYVVAIGGDFMAGRFLSQVFWLSCLALCSCLPAAGERKANARSQRANAPENLAAGRKDVAEAPGNVANAPENLAAGLENVADGRRNVADGRKDRVAGRRKASAAAAAAVALVLYNLAVPGLPAKVGPGYAAPYRFRSLREHGIADEKGQYFAQLSLAAHRAGTPLGPAPPAEAVTVEGAIGVQGYLAGTEKILVDPNGLADPLLARLPAARPWRIGHFRRELPAGYLESVAGARGRIADPGIRRLYERLCLVTRGPIWRRERWQAIAALNGF
jgi:arabinofuranosyltransferase